MKHLTIAFLFFVTLSANKCTDTSGASAASIVDQKWVFQTLNGERLDLPAGTEAPWLKLTGDQVQGFGGCNSFMGTYKRDGTDVSMPALASTKKFCEGVQPTENAIKEALGQVDSFKLEDGLLTLMGGGNALATLRGE